MRNSGVAHDWPIGIKYEAPPHYLVPTYSVLPLTIALKSSLSRVRTRYIYRAHFLATAVSSSSTVVHCGHVLAFLHHPSPSLHTRRSHV